MDSALGTPAAPAPRHPLALDPLPLPAQEPISLSPLPGPEEDAAPAPRESLAPAPPEAPVEAAELAAVPAQPDPDAERLAAESAAESARVEEELEAKLKEMPAAPDSRFRTWRPTGGVQPVLAPITPEVAAPEPSHRDGRGQGGAAADRGGDPAETRPHLQGDPLDDFFYRVDEPGPELGALAAPLEAAAAPAETVERIEYLTFLLGTEEYGVEVERVREVMRSPPITEVPRAPTDVLGVITVRGEVVAVFDPRGRLGLPSATSAEGGRIIIVDDGGGACGLLVDSVASVVRLPRGSIEACPQGIGGASADCLQGIGRDHDRLFTLLSIPALLKPGRRVEGRG